MFLSNLSSLVTVHLHIPRMPSNTWLVSGPAVGTAQTLIWSCSCLFLPPMSTAARARVFSLGDLSMSLYIYHRRGLPTWLCGSNLKLIQLVGRFSILFLSHTAPGFHLWFYLHICMWMVHRNLLLRLPWRTWVCPGEVWVWRWHSCLDSRNPDGASYSGGAHGQEAQEMWCYWVFSSLWQLCPSEDCAWRWHSCLEPGDPGGAKCIAMLAASAAGAMIPSGSGSWHSKVLFGWSFSVAWCV